MVKHRLMMQLLIVKMNSKNIDNYLEYVSGKSVAIVGPAAYLSSIKIGSQIDSFDIVVRINRGMEILNNKDVFGSRTDILYNCLIESPDNGGKIDIEFYKSNRISWVCTVPFSDYHGKCENNNLHLMVKKETVDKICKSFNFHIMDCVEYGKLNREIQCRSNTGFAAIFDIINHKAKEVFITGFSFYLDSFQDGYKSGCQRKEDEFAYQCFISNRHNQKNQWSYLKKVYNSLDNIKCDKVLDFILQMQELSREKFQNELQNVYSDQGAFSEGSK